MFQVDDGNSTTNDPFEIFSDVDVNSDGSISIDEIRQSKFNPERLSGFESKPLGSIFKELDVNNNGVIDPVEVDPSLINYNLEKKTRNSFLLIELK